MFFYYCLIIPEGDPVRKDRFKTKLRARKAFLFLAPALLLLTAGFIAAREASPDPFLVLRKGVPPGRRITPYLRYQVDMAWRQDELRLTKLAAIRTETEFLELQRELRRNLLEIIGGLPEEKTPLNPQITGRIQMDGYRIEKVVFESLPGFHVTGLLYLPDCAAGPRPAVLVTCGHSPIGKAHTSYQQISARLAKRGYVALCWDPVGQGERSQFWDSRRKRSRYNRVCGEHAVLGNLAYLAGANLARWEIWDGIRAFDYLLTRPEVDGTRISVTGTSGGGFQSSHIAALDERILAAAPSCYFCALPMRMNNRIFADPDSDPEQDIFRMVSAGIDHPGLLLLTYPRPVVVSAAVEDFFPIEGTRKSFREVEAVYRRFGHADRIALTEGYHPHSFSNYNQEFAFAFLDRFNGMPERPGLDSTKTLDEQALWCTKTGQVLSDYPAAKSLTELIRDYYLERKSRLSMTIEQFYRDSFYPGIDSWEVVPWKNYPSLNEIAWERVGSAIVEGVAVERYILHHSSLLSIPLLRIHKPGVKAQKTLLLVGSRGKVSSKDMPGIRKYLEEGFEVLSFDFRAQGENRMLYSVVSVDDPSLAAVEFDKQYYSPISGVLANYVYNSLLVGRPYYFQMIEDAEIVSRFAAGHLKAAEILVSGTGEDYTLASHIAEVLPDVNLLPGQDGRLVKWSEIVERMQEDWPVEYLLPGGAYIN